MRSETPLISVYIPTYNRLSLLRRAIDSVLAQSYPNVEVIVVDDGSTDGTQDFLRTLEQNDQRVRFIPKNGKPKGAPVSRNIAIRAAQGKFVTGLDDDDYFHPERLMMLYQHYDPGFSCIGSNWQVLSKSGYARNSVVSRIIDVNHMLLRNPLGTQVLVERERILALDGFDEALKASQDLDMWIRLIKEFGPAKRIQQPLYVMDVSHENERISSSANRIKGTHQILEKYKADFSPCYREFRLDTLKRKELGWLSKLSNYRKYNLAIVLDTLRLKMKLG